MFKEPLTKTPDLAKEVLSYFVARPGTLADLTQIAKFRLQEQRAERMVERVDAALDWLVEQRYLIQVTMLGVETQFALNSGKLGEARLFLEQGKAGVKSQSLWQWLLSLFSRKSKETVEERTFFENKNNTNSAFTTGAPTQAHEEARVARHEEPSILDQEQQRVVTRHEAIAKPQPPNIAKSRDPESVPANSTIPSLASQWLDRLLLARLQHLSEVAVQQGDHPGISRTYATAVQLLEGRGWSGLDRQSASLAESDYCEALFSQSETHHLAVATQRLRLQREEILAMTLALAAELDPVYQTVYGVLNDDMSQRVPSFGLACSLLGDPLAVRKTLAASGALTRWRLIESGAFWPRGEESLRLEASFLAWLLESAELLADPHLERFVVAGKWSGASWITDRKGVPLAARGQTPAHWLTLLTGQDPDGWRAQMEADGKRASATLARVAISPTAASWESWGEASIRIARAFALRKPGAHAVLDLASAEEEGSWDSAKLTPMIDLLRESKQPVSVIATHIEDVRVAVSSLGAQEYAVMPRSAPTQKDISSFFQAAATASGLVIQPSEANQLAMTFPLPLSKIAAAIEVAVMERDHGDAAKPTLETLLGACRSISAPDVPKFARRVRPAYSLNDIVLPADRMAQLREIVGHIQHSALVLNEWGFAGSMPYGRGVAALFSGPSGCGKTMAAHAIASALHTEAFVIDLSRVLSKYIGDSEKAFDAMFRDAQRAGAVLQIDEAEALFGKRSEVKDAHDRFANLEVAYLLQRLETYDGLVILTSNLGQELDRAFLRRLRFVIEFPRPDAAAREEIWKRCLPQEAPFEELNLKFLARRLELNGGNIRQIAVRAAFLAAAEDKKQIQMKHMVHATRAELLKLGMISAERDLAVYEAATEQQMAAGRRVA